MRALAFGDTLAGMPNSNRRFDVLSREFNIGGFVGSVY
jgi:hypothetical protein